MPPTSNMRKSSLMNSSAAEPASASTTAKRTASCRAVRANTTRPTNYYARPFGSLSGASAAPANHEPIDTAEPGFFPAIQYFSDAVTALPREVMRQFTLLKEVEAKIHGPSEVLGGMLDKLLELPIPPRKSATSAGGLTEQQAGLLSFTANNSATGSTNVSLINGVGGRHSTRGSLAGSQTGEEDVEEEIARRRQYHEMRILTHSLLPNLDEKNVVLAESNRVLALQLSRLDSVMPHLENEISEEARLGSMTHWAYSDNRQKKVAPSAAPSRREVAATNNLAAAANAIHETEIAQARREAGREAQREKAKGKRAQAVEQVDSEFEFERPKKTQAKGAKSKAAAAAQHGLGISTNGEPVKRRKVDKALAAPAMERSNSAATNKGSKASRETPRSTPAAEPSKKVTKAKPAPPQAKKRMPGSAHNSPALASSPLHSSFVAANIEPPPGARAQGTRLRQNSTTNLRHERTADEQSSRPASAAGKTNGKTSGKRKARHDEGEAREDVITAEPAPKRKETDETLKREDTEMPDASTTERPHASRSSSGKNSGNTSSHAQTQPGRAQSHSKTSTPRHETFGPDAASAAAMVRTRSTRSLRHVSGARGESSASDEPGDQGGADVERKVPRSGGGHQRSVSNSHLIKQLMPFNRSPDLDRNKGSDEDGEEGAEREHETRGEGDDVDVAGDGDVRPGRPSRPVSRRNTLITRTDLVASPSPAPAALDTGQPEGMRHDDEQPRDELSEDGNDDTLTPVDEPEDTTAQSPPNAPLSPSPSPSPPLEEDQPEPEPDLVDDEPEAEGEESEHDPDDPDEPRYCYCDRGSYGEMVACDNDHCPKEWFHLGCTELKEAPAEDETWFCRSCRPPPSKGGRRR
ncbi:hypothetical protein LTR53_011999 [Teratosphaeriaceae sp. CCFEE 6253]|nr:hypothetical protein LTR53_011999 [Teratosphaeriaceae sp. CCFEE 6253]